MRDAKVQIYTGDGKGKTTAAFGLCLRAMGRGLKVQVVQFRKGTPSGERIEAEVIGLPVLLCSMGRKSPPCASPCPMLVRTREILASDPPDLLVMDEIMAAISKSCVTVDEVLDIICSRPADTELVLTGRNAPHELIGAADLVTSMEPVKHYFAEGLAAREGIEY